MPYGYNGKTLHVDLTAGKLKVEEPGEDFFRRYMGGSALGMYYALKLIPVGAEPLGPENVLILSLGVTTGAAISGQSRVTATAKSPLSGAIGDAQAGGFWPAEAKSAGFDAYVITGRAEKPVYLWVQDGQAELRDASHLWGKVTGEVQAAIQKELGDPKIEVLQCGPAGEKGVRFACLINMSNRANGRTGMGAVMGSKNLLEFSLGPEKIQSVTGWDVSLWELIKVGERRLNMMRAFNTREGFTREHDVLPPKLAQPKREGPSDGVHRPCRFGASQGRLLCHVRLG
jgi:aldehyde:ferredoxin oxidoreductase